jgi:hypothetical protein
MDSLTLVLNAFSFILGIGIIYGSFNARLKQLERMMNDNKDMGERLARIEEQNKIILDTLIKNK